MKKIFLTAALLGTIVACSDQTTLVADADQPYMNGKTPIAATRPVARPDRIRCPNRPNFHLTRTYPVGDDPVKYCKHDEAIVPEKEPEIGVEKCASWASGRRFATISIGCETAT